MQIHYLGIRHHGPGCTRNLEKTLARIKPDSILIEMPEDTREILDWVGYKDLKPPVALLIYNPDNPQQASYYPFAEFSPEWKTIQYCLKNNIQLRCFDLPKSQSLALTPEQASLPNLPEMPDSQQAEMLQARRDPLGYMAALAGYADGESWWEEVMEKQTDDKQLFEAILELMTTLRTEWDMPESEETLLREANMRQKMRELEKDGYKNVAIVCGAWHTPALFHYDKTEKQDTLILKKLKKVKTAFTWVPWSYDLLSTSSGYGAGIHSPAWYEMLYKVKRSNILTQWMTRAAHLLRSEEMDASSAHVIEAVRLSYALASLREQAVPGLEEMMEAAVSIFGGGYPEPLQIIEQKLIIGDKMGVVPKMLSNPLQQDLELQAKKFRLKLTEKSEKELDLRTPLHLEMSRFLHRLKVLGIAWGKLQNSGNKRLSSSEKWKMEWKPTYATQVAEGVRWGNTVAEAATNFVANKIRLTEELSELVKLLLDSLKSNIESVIGTLVQKLQNTATVTKDIIALMEALPHFVGLVRYTGTDFRKTDSEAVQAIIDEIIPRICISLPTVCAALDMDAANDMWQRILQAHKSIITLDSPIFRELWYETLQKTLEIPQIDGKIQGGIQRLLLDSGKKTLEDIQIAQQFAFSVGEDPLFSVRWLDGFLMDSLIILLYNPVILGVIHHWMKGISDEKFNEYVVLLRKVFQRFQIPERQKILQMIIHNPDLVQAKSGTGSATSPTFNPEREASMKQIFQDWLQMNYPNPN